MELKRLKPITPGSRGTVLPFYRKLLSQGNNPGKRLVKGKKNASGRNGGRISMRHRGSGRKRRYRIVDFKQEKFGIPAKVESIEYDPYRTAFLSLVCYIDGERRYIVSPKGMQVGDTIVSDERAPIKIGNRMMLKNIPVGTEIHNVELKVMGGAKIARSAGNTATLLGYDKKFAHIKMPSHEIRKVPNNCSASIGSIGNKEHGLRVEGKAGRRRWKGRRPLVRGTAMNAADHPHGHGEGRRGRGRRRAVTKWGKPSGKGKRTRKRKRYSDTHIVRRRQLARKKKK